MFKELLDEFQSAKTIHQRLAEAKSKKQDLNTALRKKNDYVQFTGRYVQNLEYVNFLQRNFINFYFETQIIHIQSSFLKRKSITCYVTLPSLSGSKKWRI
jgi:hypothetical protein